jgi:hypothetical protein
VKLTQFCRGNTISTALSAQESQQQAKPRTKKPTNLHVEGSFVVFFNQVYWAGLCGIVCNGQERVVTIHHFCFGHPQSHHHQQQYVKKILRKS